MSAFIPGRLLLLTAMFGFTLLAAQAQHQLAPDHFPRYPASALLRANLAVPAGPLAVTSAPVAATALAPTVRAAAALAPLPRPSSRALSDSIPLPPRHNLTGVAPPYDIYQNWPEAQRKYTLPAPYIEPLPLQLLRGALGR